MNKVEIKLEWGQDSFRPGEEIKGRATWQLSDTPKRVTVSLLWFTSGKGTEDTEVVGQIEIDELRQSWEWPFSFTLPDAPYSFSGKLITLSWAVELVTDSPNESALQEFTMSPSGHEVELKKG